MTKVSVIIPVYNSEMYLEDAVSTVLNQTLEDIEVILINDCSTDQSGLICNKLEENDERVRVVHLEKNKGLCGARNEGIRISKGEYVAFCDNDDHFTPNLLKDNYATAITYNAQMVKYGRKLIDIDSKGNILREKESPISQFYLFEEKEKMLNNFFLIKSMGLLTNVWNGIYKRSTLIENDIWFNESMRFGSEDADFSFRFFLNTNCLAVNPKSYYIHYRRDAFSTSRKYSLNKIASMIKTAESESTIWKDIDKTPENQENIILAKNNYVINIALYQIFHKDNTLSHIEKINILKKIRNTPYLSYKLDKSISKRIRKSNLKQWLFTKLYGKKYFAFLYGLLYFENLVKGEKW
ncbi:glycosyltransferase family 2 protein [Marinilactibacillus psychrotolerans]|uniref:glycosyltransferase family 2 protein n=1 Tax=Marinilactibacillus psychrotolerans TaxID=191770 RepID=UPI003883EC72